MTRLVIVVALAGCGLTMTRGPGPTVPGQRPVCTESMEAPKRDAIPAVLGFVTILVGALFIEAGDNPDAGVPVLVGGAGVMLGSYISGGVGYYRVKRCKKAIAEFERRP
jgi:hypothetical protein